MRTRVSLLIGVTLAVFVAGCVEHLEDSQPTPDSKVTTLDQGWSWEQRQWFYHEANQGSHLVPYDWFVSLEQAGSTSLLADPKHMDALRFIVDSTGRSQGVTLPV